MPLMWTFYDYPETGLPNTNNALERLSSNLKAKIRVHNGFNNEHRKKLLDEYINRYYNSSISRLLSIRDILESFHPTKCPPCLFFGVNVGHDTDLASLNIE